MITFDPSIRLGDLLGVITIVVVTIGAYYRMSNKIDLQGAVQKAAIKNLSDLHELRLDHIDAALEDAKVETGTSKLQEMQLIQLRKEVDQLWERFKEIFDKIEELRHWKGFANPSGEYRRDGTPPVLEEDKR